MSVERIVFNRSYVLCILDFVVISLMYISMSVFLSVCLCVCHIDISAKLGPFGEFEVLLELAWQGHAAFWVSRNFKHCFMQFHPIFTQFHIILAISAIVGQFQHFAYQNAFTQAEKFNAIKMHIFDMRISMVMLSHTPFTQFSCIFMQFRQF